MKPRFLHSIAAVSLYAMFATAHAGTRPHYGGTLRVQSRDSISAMENIWVAPNSVLRQQLTTLLFDRLTCLDDSGHAHPSLAISWHTDPQQRVWEFQLRPDITFSDDSPLTSVTIATSLSKAAPQWKITAPNATTVVIETDAPTPHLPELLGLPEFSIVKIAEDKSLIGTGAFRLATFLAARRIVLTANDDYWAGRPYLDRIEITMGGSVREQLINRRLDLDDVVELSLDQARTIGYGAQSNPAGVATQRLSVSSPADLYALVFFRAATPAASAPVAKVPTDDPRIREAIALTIDRAAISHVLLQKQAEAAFSLLPQWLTGYAYLFPAPSDVERARRLRVQAYKNVPLSLPLAYDAGDNVARAVAERIAVNAREADITLQTFGENHLTLDSAATTGAQVVLVRLPLASASANAALADLTVRTGAQGPEIESASGPEALYSAEHGALLDFRIVPVVHVPQIYWLNPRVRDWRTPVHGGWRLQDVWVEGDRPASSPAAMLR